MSKRWLRTWVMLGVALAFNLLMLGLFFSVRDSEQPDCPPGWAGESCWEAQIAPAVARGLSAMVLPWVWGGGNLILILAWLAWLRSTSHEDRPQPGASAVPPGPVRQVVGPVWQVGEQGAVLRSRPAFGEPLAQLAPGEEVTERGRLGPMARVTTGAGVTGWVRASELSRPQQQGGGRAGADREVEP